jgi:hypothetical protein
MRQLVRILTQGVFTSHVGTLTISMEPAAWITAGFSVVPHHTSFVTVMAAVPAGRTVQP